MDKDPDVAGAGKELDKETDSEEDEEGAGAKLKRKGEHIFNSRVQVLAVTACLFCTAARQVSDDEEGEPSTKSKKIHLTEGHEAGNIPTVCFVQMWTYELPVTYTYLLFAFSAQDSCVFTADHQF